MKKYFSLWVFILFPVWASAQNREVVEVATDENLADKVPVHTQYLFPEFTDGVVFFANQTKSGGKMNYNMLLNEMQFVDANNAVLALDNVNNVTMVTINNRRFYPFNDKEFVEEIRTTSKLRLQVRRKGSVASHSKKGGYGVSLPTSSIEQSSIYRDGKKPVLVENVLISLDNIYYLVTANNKRTLVKNQKTFTKLFPQHKSQIEAFVAGNDIRFDNENDLKILVKYCSEL